MSTHSFHHRDKYIRKNVHVGLYHHAPQPPTTPIHLAVFVHVPSELYIVGGVAARSQSVVRRSKRGCNGSQSDPSQARSLMKGRGGHRPGVESDRAGFLSRHPATAVAAAAVVVGLSHVQNYCTSRQKYIYNVCAVVVFTASVHRHHKGSVCAAQTQQQQYSYIQHIPAPKNAYIPTKIPSPSVVWCAWFRSISRTVLVVLGGNLRP